MTLPFRTPPAHVHIESNPPEITPATTWVSVLTAFSLSRLIRTPRSDSRSDAFPSSSAPAARNARNNDVKDGDDAVNDGVKDCADSVHDCHQTGTDALKDGFDLWSGLGSGWLLERHGGFDRVGALTHDTTAPMIVSVTAGETAGDSRRSFVGLAEQCLHWGA